MLDFNAGEILLLVVIAVIVFGPEKLPELARKAARVLNYLRGIANDARGQLREQVPELADLDLAELNPRAIRAKLLGPDATDALTATAAELAAAAKGTAGVKQVVSEATSDRRPPGSPVVGTQGGGPAPGAPRGSSALEAEPGIVGDDSRVVAFDTEAT